MVITDSTRTNYTVLNSFILSEIIEPHLKNLCWWNTTTDLIKNILTHRNLGLSYFQKKLVAEFRRYV